MVRRADILLLGLLLLAAPSCRRNEHQAPYQAFSGTIKALDLETGELFIRADAAPEPWRSDRNVPCVATKDTEIYVDDRFSGLHELAVGDGIELVGYREGDRIVVSLANVRRGGLPPPLPPAEE